MKIDLMIMIIYFLAVILNGLYNAKKVETLSDFATGNKSYTTFFILATLSSSFIGGGFTNGLAEKVFSYGIIYIIALWGFSLKEILIAQYIVPKMANFTEAISVGDIMQQLYGPKAKIFTGIASMLVCAGIAGAQFGAFGYILNVLTGIDQYYGVVFASLIVIIYSSLGGMKSVVANDTLHFCVLIIALPLVLIFGSHKIGGLSNLEDVFSFNFSMISPLQLGALFLSFFFGETLVPPYVQRLLIGKTLTHTKFGTLYSGILSFFFFGMIGLIGLIAFKLHPTLNPNLALPFVINYAMPIGLKGLAIAGMMAVIMSSADSFLNAAAIAASHDVIKPILRMNDNFIELAISRFATLFIGICAIFFALLSESVLDILLISYNFWTPFILVPLVAGIMGLKRNTTTFWISAILGVVSVFCVKLLPIFKESFFDATLVGVGINALVFLLLKPKFFKGFSEITPKN